MCTRCRATRRASCSAVISGSRGPKLETCQFATPHRRRPACRSSSERPTSSPFLFWVLDIPYTPGRRGHGCDRRDGRACRRGPLGQTAPPARWCSGASPIWLAPGGCCRGIGFTADAFAWPSALKQIALLLLLIGLPIVLVIAWYHGDRGEQRVTGIELTILTLLFLLGGALFWRHYDRASEGVAGTAGGAAAAASATTMDETGGSMAERNRNASAQTVPRGRADGRLGDSSANDYFADGMTDDIITDLSKLSGILVIARNSSCDLQRQGRESAAGGRGSWRALRVGGKRQA